MRWRLRSRLGGGEGERGYAASRAAGPS